MIDLGQLYATAMFGKPLPIEIGPSSGITWYELPVRVTKVLKRYSIYTNGQLAATPWATLAGAKNFGNKSCRDIACYLQSRGYLATSSLFLYSWRDWDVTDRPPPTEQTCSPPQTA